MTWSVGEPATLLTAFLTAAAVALALPHTRLPGSPSAPKRPPAAEERAALLRLRPVLAGTAMAGAWALLGGPAGVLVGSVAVAVVWVVVGRTESPETRRRRAQLVRELPVGVALLGACVDAGASPEAALAAVGRALGGPVGGELLHVHHRLRAGISPAEVWRGVAAHPELAPLGRSLGRAHDTGGSVSDAVHRLAAELRERSQAEIETRARSIEVQAAAPLGLCLLPAFMLLGVVPMVVGIFSSMRLFQ